MNLTLSWEFLARTVIFISAVLFGVAYYVQDYHPYMDATNYGINGLLLALLFLVSGRLSRFFPLFRVVVLVIYAYVSLRFLTVAFHPEWLFIGGRATAAGVEKTLWLFLFGSVAAFAAIGLATWAAGMPGNSRRPPVVQLGPFYLISGACIFSCLLLLFNELVFGFAGSSGSGEHMNFFRRYFSRLFEPIALYTLVIVAYQLIERRTNVAVWMMRITVFLFVLILTITGSRAGIYEAIVVFIGIVPVRSNEFYLRITAKKLLLIPLLAVLLPAFFFVATSLRMFRYDFDPALFYQGNKLSVVEQISRRLSLVESTLFPVCREEMGMYDISEMVNVEMTVTNALNRMIPGKPWGYRIYSEFAWCFLIHKNGCYAYRGQDRQDYVGYEWGMWGISYQLFGYVGGIIFIFVFTFLCAYATQLMLVKNTFSTLALYGFGAYALQFWVKNLGLDNWVDRFGHTFPLLFLYCLLLNWVTIDSRRRHQRRLAARQGKLEHSY